MEYINYDMDGFTLTLVFSLTAHIFCIYGKKKCIAGHMDQLLRKAAGTLQMLPVRTLIEYYHSQESPDFKGGRRLV